MWVCVCAARVAALTFDSDVKLGVNVEREREWTCLPDVHHISINDLHIYELRERERGRESGRRRWMGTASANKLILITNKHKHK